MQNKVLYSIGFMVITIFLFEYFNPRVNLLPSNIVKQSDYKPVGPIVKGKVFIQEFLAKKDYLTGIELLTATWDRENNNTNQLLICDSSQREIFSTNISSSSLSDNDYHKINFGKNIYVGRGNKLFLHFFSNDGTGENNITLWTNTTSELGHLYVIEKETTNTFPSQSKIIEKLKGSLIIRTYESDNNGIWIKILTYLVVFIISILILYPRPLIYILLRLRMDPAIFLLVTGLIFGIIFVFLTPPIQVPDERVHLIRAYQISEGNIFQIDQTVPSSIIKFDDLSMRAYYEGDSSIKYADLKKVKLEKTVRENAWTYWYVVPYVPQAIGVLIGRTFGFETLGIMYSGRFFNLLLSIIVIYVAIRIIPVFKWQFVLLSLMPMTLSQLASNSYDAMAIALAFLYVAYILKLKVENNSRVRKSQIAVLFILSILLALCRPVYVLLLLLYFLLPAFKFGSLLRYIFTFISISIFVLITPFVFSIIRELIAEANSLLPIPWKDPVPQLNFIIENPLAFTKVLFSTIFIYQGTFYLESFVGILGWLDNPLPKIMVYSYLAVLFINAMFNKPNTFKLDNNSKVLSLLIFAGSIFAIELALYLTWTPVGYHQINGAQGRYFIPISPIIFLVFYNTKIYSRMLSIFTQSSISSYLQHNNDNNNKQYELSNVLFDNMGKLLLSIFVYITLISTIFVIIQRYYV